MKIEEAISKSRASIEKSDLRQLIYILEEIGFEWKKIARILEVGMHRGYSMETWINMFSPHIIIGVEKDLPTPDAFASDKDYHHLLWGCDSHDEETKAKVEMLLNHNKVDMLFIDGDHSYEGVKQDFEMYSPFVRKGGIVIFHDAIYHADKTEEVDLFWKEIKKLYEVKAEIKSSDNSTGFGIIML